MRRRFPTLALALHLAAFAPLLAARFTISEATAAEGRALASAWAADHNARARLIVGGSPPGAPAGTIAAGVEIEIAKDWKTYWRNPGSSGVPPTLNWDPSSNLAAAETLFPVPARLTDRDGDTFGYKGHVIFPVTVRATDAAKPIALVLEIEYGVCKDICIPVQSRLELTIPPSAAGAPTPTELVKAFDAVPRRAEARRPADPRLRAANVTLAGDKPSVRLEAEFPGGAAGSDLFLEAPDGLWIPLAKPYGEASGDVASFIVDLTEGAAVDDLKGKTIRVTLVSPRGQSEATFKIE